MSHMPSYGGSGSACSGSGSCGSRIIEYTATGAESPSGFVVPIGTTLAAADYHVQFFGVEDDVIVPLAWSFPTSGKTYSQFEARFAGDELTAGGVYKFQIVEA